jgi:S1-C subfamily serine protease
MEGSDFRPERREVMRMISRARPGNSGGPVVDLQGRVVGMVFAHRRGAGYTSYAVPTPIVKSALRRTGPPVDTGSCDEE